MIVTHNSPLSFPLLPFHTHLTANSASLYTALFIQAHGLVNASGALCSSSASLHLSSEKNPSFIPSLLGSLQPPPIPNHSLISTFLLQTHQHTLSMDRPLRLFSNKLLKPLQKQPSSTYHYAFLISFASYPFKWLVYSHSLELTSLTLSSLVFSHFTPQELLSLKSLMMSF